MLFRSASVALAAALAMAPAAALADPAKPVAAETMTVKAPVAAPHQDAASYAARDQKDKQAANYEGGSVVVVGISGGAIVVLLLLLLILA